MMQEKRIPLSKLVANTGQKAIHEATGKTFDEVEEQRLVTADQQP